MNKDLKETVANIQALNSRIEDGKVSQFSDDEVSVLAVKLAAYNTTLGEFKVKLMQEYDNAEAAHKFKVYTTYEKLRNETSEGKKTYSQEDAKAKAELENATEYAEVLNAKHASALVKQLSDDTQNTISTLQSRIKVLTGQRTNPSEG